MEYTNLEKTVFNALLEFCIDNPEADVHDLSSNTGLSKESIKGVVGSLVKKEIVQVGKDKRNGKDFNTINPIVNNELLSFGCDEYSEAEIESFKI
jgi:predicted transcriptional regulator